MSCECCLFTGATAGACHTRRHGPPGAPLPVEPGEGFVQERITRQVGHETRNLLTT